ncbi:MAG: recombinase family protein [Alphaproteobacteria bacterium]|nr:MAG: recombinase family protein [Alphaproteobacteria bacterium]
MPRADASRRRCAIYTRKSTEEGLEQEFNSLAAQREACEAYIRSQQHEGWVLARNRYDDGGFSGGNLDRPALQCLLADIRAGRIDIVVVYKVDRLTRSLADFARLVEIFDAQGVSFVSVTQQFNTTSSMGRLTLNVLLSFAQFEREVTGERIRDKIAASKKKGMWMGGNPPLGYDASERALVINPAEAETVRRIFALYRELGGVRRVKDQADRLGLRTKRSTTAKGAERGGTSFSRGHIYRLLSNPIYTGQIAHKGQLYPGQHPSLIDDETWTAVRDQLAAHAGDHRRRAKAAEPSLLAGLLVDANGERLTPSHAVKKGRRYRYYVSTALISEAGQDHTQSWRLAAQEIEDCVISVLADALASPARLLERLSSPGMPGDQIRRLIGRAARLAALLRSAPRERARIVQQLVEQVIVDDKRIIIKMRRRALLGVEASLGASEQPSGNTIELTAAVDFKRRGAETKLVLPGLAPQNHASRCDPALIKAIARGRGWFEELATGRARSLQDLAKRDAISRRYIRRLVDLSFLSPELVLVILQGRQPVELTATRLTELDLPLDWAEQHKLLAS